MNSAVTRSLVRKIRLWLVLFIIGLVLSGLTAFPLQRETDLLNRLFGVAASPQAGESALHIWLRRVHDGIVQTNRNFPFMAYGTDWLAFAHLVIAIAFIGPLQDPVRNRWILIFGVMACVGVLPLALIGPHSRNSTLLASHRLHLWHSRRHTAAALPALCAPHRRRQISVPPERSSRGLSR